MIHCRSLTLEQVLAKFDEEFKSVEEEYMTPRIGDDVCTNEEDAGKSAMAFSLPKLTLQPINDKLTSDEVAKYSMTISSSESHPSQSMSDVCVQELPRDFLQVKQSLEDPKKESIIDDDVDDDEVF